MEIILTSRKVNPLCGTITNGIDFLVTKYKHGLTYSSLNTARSALSTVILMPNGNTFENHPLVTRLMKGVFESRPTLPRYNSIWNPSTVLDFIKTLRPNEELSLKNVALKCYSRCIVVWTEVPNNPCPQNQWYEGDQWTDSF